ncbi:unnamed protein product, partial [marine sediment metagenome]
ADYIAKHYKGGNNSAENKFHHARFGPPGRLEAKTGKNHPDTPCQGQLSC